MSELQVLDERQLLGKTQHELRMVANTVGRMLPSVASLTPEQLADIVLTYADTIRPTFIPLLSLTWLRVQSPEAIHACRSNLECEVGEDHPAMLDRFVTPLWEERIDHSRRMQAKQRAGVLLSYAEKSALYGVSVLALLEHTSAAFMPWLADAGRKLQLTDFTYTQMHGEADIAHAKDLTQAVVSEALLLNVTQDILVKPTQDVLHLCRAMFCVEQY
ncbi:MAG: hypothetical protein WCV85_01790 [Patescibacteria group bacterium]|jgi:hypothetical protein